MLFVPDLLEQVAVVAVALPTLEPTATATELPRAQVVAV
jgi:hypothetical protein